MPCGAIAMEHVGTQGDSGRAAEVADNTRALLAEPTEIAFRVTLGPHLQPLGSGDPHSANVLKSESALGAGRRRQLLHLDHLLSVTA